MILKYTFHPFRATGTSTQVLGLILMYSFLRSTSQTPFSMFVKEIMERTPTLKWWAYGSYQLLVWVMVSNLRLTVQHWNELELKLFMSKHEFHS